MTRERVHPQVGMLFVVPGVGDALRVNGDSSTWPERAEVPTAGQLVRSMHDTEAAAEAIDDMLRHDARVNQY